MIDKEGKRVCDGSDFDNLVKAVVNMAEHGRWAHDAQGSIATLVAEVMVLMTADFGMFGMNPFAYTIGAEIERRGYDIEKEEKQDDAEDRVMKMFKMERPLNPNDRRN